jgi:hypothetical protein
MESFGQSCKNLGVERFANVVHHRQHRPGPLHAQVLRSPIQAKSSGPHGILNRFASRLGHAFGARQRTANRRGGHAGCTGNILNGGGFVNRLAPLNSEIVT